MSNSDTAPAVIITRTFDAPIDTVWSMFAEAEHFGAWYGPQGAELEVQRFEPEPGGGRLVCMRMPTPQGTHEMWFTGEFVELDPPTRLVYTESVCDATGRILTAAEMGMPDGAPTTTRVVVDLTSVGSAADGSTQLTLTHEGIPAGSPGEMGWQMALDKLAARLTP